jgi:putative transcription antitermination factor YqgF
MWLGLDLGRKRTGVATSESGQLATPWGSLIGSPADQVQQLCQLMEQMAVTTVVVGVPRLPGGQPSWPEHIHNFLFLLTPELDKRQIPLEVVDETLTTKEAERRLGHRPGKDDKTDALAAQIILEQYFLEKLDDQNDQ